MLQEKKTFCRCYEKNALIFLLLFFAGVARHFFFIVRLCILLENNERRQFSLSRKRWKRRGNSTTRRSMMKALNVVKKRERRKQGSCVTLGDLLSTSCLPPRRHFFGCSAFYGQCVGYACRRPLSPSLSIRRLALYVSYLWSHGIVALKVGPHFPPVRGIFYLFFTTVKFVGLSHSWPAQGPVHPHSLFALTLDFIIQKYIAQVLKCRIIFSSQQNGVWFSSIYNQTIFF